MELKTPIRYRVCFTCKIFKPIFPDNPVNMKELKIFDIMHSGHMVQIVNFGEIPEKFTRIKSGRAREETLGQIQEMLKV